MTPGLVALSSCTIKLHYQVALLSCTNFISFYFILFFNFCKDTSRVTPGLVALSMLHYQVALILFHFILFYFLISAKIHQG